MQLAEDFARARRHDLRYIPCLNDSAGACRRAGGAGAARTGRLVMRRAR